MATPKKTEKKKSVSKNTVQKKAEKPVDLKTQKRPIDDDDEFDASLEDLDYDHLGDYDEDDDF